MDNNELKTTEQVNEISKITDDETSFVTEEPDAIDDAVSMPDENVEEEAQSSVQKSVRFSKGKKAAGITCGVILLLLIVGIAVVIGLFYHFYSLMDITHGDEIRYNDNVSFSDEELSEVPKGEVIISGADIYIDKAVTNILLIGTDERSEDFNVNARADSIMVLSMNSRTNQIKLVSLERGMLVNIPGRKNDILTHTFRYGGANLLMETVRTHFQLDVNKYIRVNLSMFQRLIDEVDGVDITLTAQEAYGLNTPNFNTWPLERKVYEGENHFNGYEALQYARMRWIDSDWQRIERQRNVINSIKKKMSGMSVSELNDLSEKCLPYVQTNLSSLEFANLMLNIPQYIGSEMEQMTIPEKGTYRDLGHVDFEQNTFILRQFLYE